MKQIIIISIVSALALLLFAPLGTLAQDKLVPQGGTDKGKPVEPLDEAGSILFKKVDPCVVAIQHEEAGGSGFIVDPSGYIVSNGHVVSSAMGGRYGDSTEDPTEVAKRITVILSDERKFQARVIGHCLDPDVSLLKIDASL